jgi:hypothetical protein
MGYTTDFGGRFEITPALNDKQMDYINRINRTRRMKRDVNKLMELYKGKHGYPFTKSKDPNKIYGNEGEYFAMEDGQSGQSRDASILDYNQAPGQASYGDKNFESIWKENEKRADKGICQPGLWCQWEVVMEDDKCYLQWDGGEKFYAYVEWLKYLVNHFFSKWKVNLNGTIHWTGEDSSDMGKIKVTDNVVTVHEAVITYKDDEE